MKKKEEEKNKRFAWSIQAMKMLRFNLKTKKKRGVQLKNCSITKEAKRKIERYL